MTNPNPEAHDLFMQAMAQHQAGAIAEAEKLYRMTLRNQRNHPDALHMLGVLAFQRGDTTAALRYLDRALLAVPDFADALNTSAGVHLKLENLDQALDHVQRAIAQRPASISIQRTLARVHQKRGEHEEAIATFRQIDQAKPDDLSVLDGWGSSLLTLGRYVEAAATIERALAIDPRNTDLRCFLAQALKGQGLFHEASKILEAVLADDPSCVPALVHMGDAYQALGRIGDAVDTFRRAIQIAPDHAEAHFNYGVALLTTGDYRQGWDEYAWRFKMEAYANRRPYSAAPTWAGEPLNGKSIMMVAEQGLGDTLQFARYAKPLADMGATVHSVIARSLSGLIPTVEGMSHVHVFGETLPDVDFQISMMEVPHVLGTGIDDAPTPTGYLTPPVDRFEVPARPCVGLVWQGNTAHTRDSIRSLPLACFDRLLDRDDVTFASLQFGPGTSQIDELGWRDRLIDLSPQLEGFDNTADVVSKLDLVITVDTSMAHLAGALGIPTWVLLASSADWRWGLSTSESGWYSATRLFRQTELGKWDSVFDVVASTLSKRFPSS